MKELLNILSIDIALTIVIVNCGMASKVLKEAKKKGVSGGTILIGKGIVGSKLSRILGIDEARKEIKELFGSAVFDTPKPTKLIGKMLGIATSANNNDIVLDFFAGSGTTGHAVMLHNVLNAHRVKYILVQLPESLEAMAKTATGLSKKIILNSIKYLNERSLSLNICMRVHLIPLASCNF